MGIVYNTSELVYGCSHPEDIGLQEYLAEFISPNAQL